MFLLIEVLDRHYKSQHSRTHARTHTRAREHTLHRVVSITHTAQSHKTVSALFCQEGYLLQHVTRPPEQGSACVHKQMRLTNTRRDVSKLFFLSTAIHRVLEESSFYVRRNAEQRSDRTSVEIIYLFKSGFTQNVNSSDWCNMLSPCILKQLVAYTDLHYFIILAKIANRQYA